MNAAGTHSSDPGLRRAIGRAAVEYARHGWTVVPVSHFDGRHYDCVQADCSEESLHPVWRMWQNRASSDPKVVANWFRMLTLSVAVRTGVSFDVVSLPEVTATRVQAALGERLATPVAVWRERGRRLFWVELDLPWRPVLGQLDGRVCGEDDWAPAPPTPTRHGPLQWAVDPEQTDWTVARHADFLAALATVAG